MHLSCVLQDEPPIPDADRVSLRNEIIPAMINLSSASDKAMRAQVAESISLIASSDFPERWPDLVDVSLSSAHIYEFLALRQVCS